MKTRGRPPLKKATAVAPSTEIAPRSDDVSIGKGKEVVAAPAIEILGDCPFEAQAPRVSPELNMENSPEKEVQILGIKENQSWVDIIKGNRLIDHGLGIPYTAPQLFDGVPEVAIEPEDVASELLYWENAVIMYVLGQELSMNAVKQYMVKNWNFAALPELYYNEEGFFIIRFKSAEDKMEVLKRGPYTVYNMPMFIRNWTPDFDLKENLLRILPLWVMFPKLPLHLWGEKSLGKIASAIGKPVVTDECTAKKLRVSYARVLIEVDVTVELKETVMINDQPGKKFVQPVEYEWRPLFCRKCRKVGHECDKKQGPVQQQGRKVVHKNWKEKQAGTGSGQQQVFRTEANCIVGCSDLDEVLGNGKDSNTNNGIP